MALTLLILDGHNGSSYMRNEEVYRRCKVMFKVYKYIYYWLYTWQKKLWGERDVPEFNAAIGMSMSLAAVLASIAIVIELLTGIRVIPSDATKGDVILVGIMVLTAHFFLFVFKKKYLQIENEFENESKEKRKRRGVWVLLYTFGSLAFFIALLFFGAWINN